LYFRVLHKILESSNKVKMVMRRRESND
jgi:hypothetical protein